MTVSGPARIVTALLVSALVLAATPACSWLSVKAPPPRTLDGAVRPSGAPGSVWVPPAPPVSCTDSYAAPILDILMTLAGGLFMIAALADGEDAAAAGLVGGAVGVTYGFSARSGLRDVKACKSELGSR